MVYGWSSIKKNQESQRSFIDDVALDEALCFGWIDSIIKKVDESKYVRKFTKEMITANGAEINKKRIEVLIKEKRMTKFGMRKIDIAKQNGKWFELDRPEISYEHR